MVNTLQVSSKWLRQNQGPVSHLDQTVLLVDVVVVVVGEVAADILPTGTGSFGGLLQQQVGSGRADQRALLFALEVRILSN